MHVCTTLFKVAVSWVLAFVNVSSANANVPKEEAVPLCRKLTSSSPPPRRPRIYEFFRLCAMSFFPRARGGRDKRAATRGMEPEMPHQGPSRLLLRASVKMAPP